MNTTEWDLRGSLHWPFHMASVETGVQRGGNPRPAPRQGQSLPPSLVARCCPLTLAALEEEEINLVSRKQALRRLGKPQRRNGFRKQFWPEKEENKKDFKREINLSVEYSAERKLKENPYCWQEKMADGSTGRGGEESKTEQDMQVFIQESL